LNSDQAHESNPMHITGTMVAYYYICHRKLWLFAKGLNDRYAKDGIRAYVVDPGLVNTDIGNKGTGGLVNFVWSLRKKHGVSPDVPAKTYAFLCEQKDRQNGLYYYLCKEINYSKEVTSENANRLFELSERLCGIRYEGKEMVAV